MQYLPVSGLPLIEEEDATDQVAEIYADLRRELQVPFVPNMSKALASSPSALAFHTELSKQFFSLIKLPQSLTSIILYAIATTGNCTYCSAGQELTCRSLGIDEATLNAVVEDLDNVSPFRLQTIIDFAINAAHHPQQLVAEDYERVRDQGVTDEELAEIITIVAVGNYLDTLADVLKIEVERPIVEALGL